MFTLLRNVDRRTASQVADAIELLKHHTLSVHTMTTDNGKEFTFHERVYRGSNIDFYFYSPTFLL